MRAGEESTGRSNAGFAGEKGCRVLPFVCGKRGESRKKTVLAKVKLSGILVEEKRFEGKKLHLLATGGAGRKRVLASSGIEKKLKKGDVR